MTLSTTVSRADYITNSLTTVFPTGFRFLSKSHLLVIITDLVNGAVYTLGESQFEVTGVGGALGGDVVISPAMASGKRVSILRNVPFTQLRDYVENDPFPAESHEQALDLLTMQTQQLREVLDRALTLPSNSPPGTNTSLPSPKANWLIGWNSTATGLQNYDPDNVNTSGTVIYNPPLPGVVPGTVENKLMEMGVSVRDFGAVGGDAVKDTAAFLAASLSGAKNIFVPKTSLPYLVFSPVPLSNGQTWYSEFGAKIDASGLATGQSLFEGSGAEGVSVPLAVNASKGGSSVTLVGGVPTGATVGSVIRLRSDGVFDPNRTGTKLGELLTIKSISGNVVTFDGSIFDDYLTSDSAGVSLITPIYDVTFRGWMYANGPNSPSGLNRFISIKKSVNVTVENTQSFGFDSRHIDLEDALYGRVINCRVYAALNTTTGYGVSVSGASRDCIVEGLVATDCRHATTTSNPVATGGIVRNTVFRGCVNEYSRGDGFDTHAAAEGIRYENCVSKRSESRGFNVECSSATIVGCESHSSVENGISLNNFTGRAASYTVLDCKVIRAGNFGLRVGQGSSLANVPTQSVSVQNCRLHANGAGLLVRGFSGSLNKNVSVVGNYVSTEQTSGNGALIVEFSEGVSVVGNNVQTKGAYGIRLNSCEEVVISNNTVFLPNGGSGAVYMSGVSRNSLAISNVLTGAGSISYGVYIDPTCVNCGDLDNLFSIATNPYNIATTDSSNYSSNRTRQTSSLSSGTVTILDRHVKFVLLDTEGGAATGTLTNILGGIDDQIITLSTVSNARDITVTDAPNGDATGIQAAGALTLDNAQDTVSYIRVSNNLWREIHRSGN